MGLIVTEECFTGVHFIPQDCFDDLNPYIDRYEEHYLCCLLKELREPFVADLLNGVPQSSEYLEWFNPFCKEIEDCNTCGKWVNSKGFKDVLVTLVYYHYVKDNHVRLTTNGFVNIKTSQEDKLNYINMERQLDMSWNEAVDSWKAIKYCIDKNYDCCCECNDCIDYKLIDFV